MKIYKLSFLSGFVFLLFFPGCRIIDWGKDSFYQGQELKKDLDYAKGYIRSSRVYDQFELIGSFDSLWLTDEVRSAYADIYASKHGRTEEEKKIFLRRQLEENNHFLSFYILSVADIVIGDKDSNWTLFLKIGDNNFVPTEFKAIELPHEYILIFGKKFNPFKVAYILRFNSKDIDDVPLIQQNTDSVQLVFRSTSKEIVQTWKVEN